MRELLNRYEHENANRELFFREEIIKVPPNVIYLDNHFVTLNMLVRAKEKILYILWGAHPYFQLHLLKSQLITCKSLIKFCFEIQNLTPIHNHEMKINKNF